MDIDEWRSLIRTWEIGDRPLQLNNVDLQGSILEGANLTGANLEGAHLKKVNLRNAVASGANLKCADFTKAILEGADFSWTDLRKADLAIVNLDRTDLNGANLKGADLRLSRFRRADFRNAELSQVDFRGSDLSGANFENAHIHNTLFVECNLTSALGLEKLQHSAPSTVDNATIQKSGLLPEVFLRGCGFSDWQIEASKLGQANLAQSEIVDICYKLIQLRGEQPVQLFSPFISYSNKDSEFASKLHEKLQDSGVRCWYAPEDMKIGDKIRLSIDEAIQKKDKLLLVLSEESVKSNWVEDEVDSALEKEHVSGTSVLFPIKIDDAIDSIKTGWPAKIRRSTHIGDFRNWQSEDSFENAFARMLCDLRA